MSMQRARIRIFEALNWAGLAVVIVAAGVVLWWLLGFIATPALLCP